MKKALLALFLILLVIPLLAIAHGENSTVSQDPGFMMMEQIEDQALGDKLHEEMEGLMIKMIAGDLTEAEIDRMSALMDQYPGPGSMMMSRMMEMGTFESVFNSSNQNSMMGYYGLGGLGGGLLMILFWILVIIGIVVFAKYIMGDKKLESSKNALDILKERYAKGEIDKNEFETKRKDLQG